MWPRQAYRRVWALWQTVVRLLSGGDSTNKSIYSFAHWTAVQSSLAWVRVHRTLDDDPAGTTDSTRFNGRHTHILTCSSRSAELKTTSSVCCQRLLGAGCWGCVYIEVCVRPHVHLTGVLQTDVLHAYRHGLIYFWVRPSGCRTAVAWRGCLQSMNVRCEIMKMESPRHEATGRDSHLCTRPHFWRNCRSGTTAGLWRNYFLPSSPPTVFNV